MSTMTTIHGCLQRVRKTVLGGPSHIGRLRRPKAASNIRGLLATAVVSLAAWGCNGSAEAGHATARLHDAAGRQVGTAQFQVVDDGVLMTLELDGLPPGEHALHVHERGACEPPSFESAGGHLALPGSRHGLADEGVTGAHTGDLVSVIVDDAGRAKTHRVVMGATLDRDAPGDTASLLREGGTSIVIHAQPDDYRSEPSGASGDRIACGVIERAAAG